MTQIAAHDGATLSRSAEISMTPMPASMEVVRRQDDVPVLAVLKDISAATGKPPLEIMSDFAQLAFGPGSISIRDYMRLRLFDHDFYADSDRKSVIGQRRNRDLIVKINYRHDWHAVLENKIAMNSYLAAYGLPTIPFKAIYAPELTGRADKLLTSREGLRRFLLQPEIYPLFGKPAEGFQSLGSISLIGCIPEDEQVEKSGGERVAIDHFIQSIEAHFSAGYVFQSTVAPHPALEAIVGARLATARIVTMRGEAGAEIFRACLKLPVSPNTADNYWRPGNLLAEVSIPTGEIQRAVTGTGLTLKTVAAHPDSGIALQGKIVPNWESMKAVALEGARAMRHVPLIGWDIASTAEGAVIVEMNVTPDLFLNQIADRRGALADKAFISFMDFQKQEAEAYTNRRRAEVNRL